MGELILVGMGLCDEKDVSLRGIEEMKNADIIFAELYTSFMPRFSIPRLEEVVGKKILVVSRRVLEEEDGQMILREARKGKAVLLVPGDPLIATTHVDLRIRAEKEGIKSRVIHGASIISAVIGLSNLQYYKFGRSVTIPFTDRSFVSETPYEVITENKKIGLHTLCFLDVRAEEKRYMTIGDALNIIKLLEEKRRMEVATLNTLVVGIARAGSTDSVVKAGYINEIKHYDFGAPPHCLIFPGKLHFMEAEALVVLADAPEEVRRLAN